MACSFAKAIGAGFVGACALTLLHEVTRRSTRRAPRLDILGMRALARSLRAADVRPPSRLHESALAGDLVANTAFYSLVAAAGPQNALLSGSLLGVGAGLGSVILPQPFGLGRGPTGRTVATQAMTIGMYVAGGMMAAAAYKRMRE